MKVAYIPGFNLNPNGLSTTYQYVQQIVPTGTITKCFKYKSLQSPYKIQQDLYKRLKEFQPDIIIGHSLGGLFTLAYDEPVHRLVINPCMYMSEQLVEKLGQLLSVFIHTKDYKEIETATYSAPNFGDYVVGSFAKKDRMCSYLNEFKQVYPASKIIQFAGGHRPTQACVKYVWNQFYKLNMSNKATGKKICPLPAGLSDFLDVHF